MPMSRRAAAEFIGTFWLVLGGCGTAVLAGQVVEVLGISLAFGLTVVTMAYAIGHISGCHLNPAVTLGLWAGRRFAGKDILPYVVAQILGAIVAIAVLYLVASGRDGFNSETATFAANGYGKVARGEFVGSPMGYGLVAALVTEFVMTCVFVIVIFGATDKLATAGMAGLAIGLALTLIHLISIPVTNTSVNPARSIGPAVFAGVAALKQLWVFIVAPIAGGIAGGLVYSRLLCPAGSESKDSKGKKSKK
jgi:aquaporin Z